MALKELFLSQTLPYKDMQRVLDLSLGKIDESLLFPEHQASLGEGIGFIDKIQFFQLQSYANYLRDHLSEFRTLANLAPHEYAKTTVSPFWVETLVGGGGKYLYEGIIENIASAHQTNAMQLATKLSFQIEDYKTSNGTYPETLEELIPEFFEAVPLNPMDEKPFLYERSESAYSLTSPELLLYDIDGNQERIRPITYVKGSAFE